VEGLQVAVLLRAELLGKDIHQHLKHSNSNNNNSEQQQQRTVADEQNKESKHDGEKEAR
jgi:hypothetical protein